MFDRLSDMLKRVFDFLHRRFGRRRSFHHRCYHRSFHHRRRHRLRCRWRGCNHWRGCRGGDFCRSSLLYAIGKVAEATFNHFSLRIELVPDAENCVHC